MIVALTVYALVGLLAIIVAATLAERKGDGTDWSFMAIGDISNPLSIAALFLLWPVWLALELIGIVGARSTKRHMELNTQRREQIQENALHREASLLNRPAKCVSAMRPFGTILVANQRLQAKSQDGMLTEGTEVEITEFQGGVAIVQERSNK